MGVSPMQPRMSKPFCNDPDRHHIWHRLIQIDSEAFALGDWSIIEPDFDRDHFEGIRCNHSLNPDDWTIFFPDVASYRDNWLKASAEFRAKQFLHHTPLEALLARTRLDRIDINRSRALAHKKFSGDIPLADGTFLSGSRQTLYRLHKRLDRWRITGFLGFL